MFVPNNCQMGVLAMIFSRIGWLTIALKTTLRTVDPILCVLVGSVIWCVVGMGYEMPGYRCEAIDEDILAVGQQVQVGWMCGTIIVPIWQTGLFSTPSM